MAKVSLPENYLLGGTNPSILKGISEEECRNLMVFEDSLAPFHGKGEDKSIDSQGRLLYKSDQTGNLYIIAERFLYEMSSSFVIRKLAEFLLTANIFSVAELSNGSLSITTGEALYVFQDKSLAQVTSSQGLKIKDPYSCITIDSFIFVSDNKATFQISAPNQPLNYSEGVTYEISSKASNIVALAEINRTLFVVGSSAIERWVIVGGDQIVERDNVFLQPYGLYDRNSFTNKFNIFVGVFVSQGGQIRVMAMQSESNLKLISTPGIEKIILTSGDILSPDLYEIDQNLFYEISFGNSTSLVFNFFTEKWHTSDSPYWQLNIVDNIPYGLLDNKIYKITPYSNPLMKSRITRPFLNPENFQVSEFNLFYTNPTSRSYKLKLAISLNGIQYIYQHDQEIGNHYYGVISSSFPYGYQFSLKFETLANVYWRGVGATLEVQN